MDDYELSARTLYFEGLLLVYEVNSVKNILKYLMFFILLNVLSGCTGIGSSKIMLDEKNQALPSSIGAILSDFSFASLGTGEIAYLTADPEEIVFLDRKQNRQFIELSQNFEALEITAGNDYFYVYCTNEDEIRGILNIYDNKGELIKKISLPFKRVSVNNGIVYGYYDETADFF